MEKQMADCWCCKKKRKDYGEYNNVLLRVSDVFYHTYESACAITLPLAVFHTEKV